MWVPPSKKNNLKITGITLDVSEGLPLLHKGATNLCRNAKIVWLILRGTRKNACNRKVFDHLYYEIVYQVIKTTNGEVIKIGMLPV